MSYYFVSRIGGCSHENSFPVISLLKQRNRYFSSRSYMKCFHGWVRFNSRGLLGGKILRETIFTMASTNLISKLDTIILCLREVLHLLEIQRQQNTFIMSFSLQIPNSLRDKFSHWDSQNETLITHYEKKKQKPR